MVVPSFPISYRLRWLQAHAHKNSQKKDLVFYKDLGFEQMSCFACSLCDEYVSLFGDPDFSALE